MIDLPLREAGYLSNEAVHGEDGVASHYPAAFAKLADANSVAMAFLREVSSQTVIEDDADRAVICVLLVIVVRRFQAAVILMRRLLLPEAEAMGRTGLEATFLIGAYFKDPEGTLEILRVDRTSGGKKGMSAMIDHKEGLALSTVQVEQLEEALAALPSGGGGIQWEQLSMKAGMIELYTTLYRSASMTAVHVTERTMERHVTVNEDGVSVDFLSDGDSLPATARNALHVLYAALTTVGQVYKMESFGVAIQEIGASVALPLNG